MELLTKAMNEHFKKMTHSHKPLYRVNCTGDELWSRYLEGFQPDPVFRDPNSSEHNCNMCKHFITHYGNIVSLNDDNTFTSIFDFEIPQLAKEEYEKIMKVDGFADNLIEIFSDLFDDDEAIHVELYDKENEKEKDFNVCIYMEDKTLMRTWDNEYYVVNFNLKENIDANNISELLQHVIDIEGMVKLNFK